MPKAPHTRLTPPAVAGPVERGVRHQCGWFASRTEFASQRLCLPLRATARAVAVPRVCGEWQGLCMALCALQREPTSCAVGLARCRQARCLSQEDRFLCPVCPWLKRAALSARCLVRRTRAFERARTHAARTELSLRATEGDPSALRLETTPPEYSRLRRVVVFSSRRQAHILLEYWTAVVLMPNVRVNRPAEASAVSLVRDDAPCAADQAYGACRSGSG